MKRYFVYAFLGFATFSHAMEDNSKKLEKLRNKWGNSFVETSTISPLIDSGPNTLDISEFECDEPTEERKQMYEMILANAPEEINSFLKTAQYAGPLRENWLLLYGATGTGKSNLAEAIAFRLGSKCFIIPASSIIRDRRGAAAELLNYIFRRLANEPGKKTLVIDEINILAENYTSEHTDTKETSSALWTNMDKFKSNLDFFMIGTSNETKKMPAPLQDRFKYSSVEITGRHNNKRQLIEHYLGVLDIPKDPSIDEQFIERLAEKLRDFSPRNIKSLLGCAQRFYPSLEPSKKLTSASIEKALEKVKYASEQGVWDFSPPISDDDRRHQESLRRQKDFHDQQVVNNAAIESGLAWNSEKGSFINYSKEGYGNHHIRSGYDDHRDEVFRFLTPEQKELMQKQLDVQTKEKKEEEAKRQEEEKKQEEEEKSREEEAKKNRFWTRFMSFGPNAVNSSLLKNEKED